MSAISRRVAGQLQDFRPVVEFFDQVARRREAAGGEFSDFVAGDPQEMALPGYVDALRRWSRPRRPDWFAYKMSEPESQAIVAKSLRERFGHDVEPEDVAMTNGAIAGLAVTLRLLCDPGDEVIVITPPHFLYPLLIRAAGGSPVRVGLREDLELDVDAIEDAITERTRAIIVNSPHNPTGKIFSPEGLQRLSDALETESSDRARPIYLISDEAYNRILFDGREFASPIRFYERSFLVYTYAKTLLSPGQRLGYVALGPGLAGDEGLRDALVVAQVETGWAFPNAVLQHALADLENLTIDIEHLQRKRDLMVGGLRKLGYDLHVPEATFYLLPRSPLADDVAFTDTLAEHRIFVMPGALLEAPGSFRISLTATEEMIERSWPGFEAALAGLR